MKKPAAPGRKLAGMAGFLLLVGVWYWCALPCPILALTGIPCPGCGITRAWLCALELELGSAFCLHPMFWSVPILAALFVFDGQLLPGKHTNTLLVGILAAGILLTYLARFFGFLGGFPPV